MPERISGMLTKIFYEAEGAANGGTAAATAAAGEAETRATQQTEETFETWIEKQDDKVKKLYNDNVSGLKKALTTERENNKTLSGQLKELLPKAEKGSDLEQQLTEMANKAESAERRAAFAEEGIKPEIGCRNVKAAYALAVADDLFKKDGSPDWEELKKQAPELFGKAKPSTDAGAQTPTTGTDMNALIRQKAGR
jgi:hypothetical protein